MAVDHINAQGGVKALGGAKLKLVVLDSGDSTEKAKSAAQRMVAQEPDLVAASAAYLSSFTLAVTVWPFTVPESVALHGSVVPPDEVT